ncbi:MAG: glycosyltransferase family 4 protein [Candidatus Ratteibacteria bacterium]
MKNTYKIGIDSHAIGLKQGGNETYICGLLKGISQIEDTDFRYFVFLTKGVNPPDFLYENKYFKFIKVSTSPFIRFLIDIPLITYNKKLNLLHTQYHLPFISYCPGIITVHDVSFLKHPEFFPKQLYLKLKFSLLYSLRKAKKIITCSKFSKKEIIELYHVKDEKIEVIYNGVSENFRPLKINEKTEILKKYSITKPYILSVSNLQPRKNLSRLIKAFALLVKNNEKFPYILVIVGRKLWLYKDIFVLVKETNLEDKIIFTDFIPEEDLLYLYNFADVFVYPSLYEGFGLPVVEAMACGCPVITSNLSSLPEIVEDAGIIIDPYDIEEIAKAIKEVICNPELKKSLKFKGLKQSKKFSWKNTAEKTLKVYEEVLK